MLGQFKILFLNDGQLKKICIKREDVCKKLSLEYI